MTYSLLLAAALVANTFASPLQVRQGTATAPSILTGVVLSTSVPSILTGVVLQSTVASTSILTGVVSSTSPSILTGVVLTVTSAATPTSSAPTPTSSVPANPLYPCPAGYLLTYYEQSATFPVSLNRTLTAFGNWTTSAFFPNVTTTSTISAINSTHTLNYMGMNITEQLVNRSGNSTAGFRNYAYNVTNGPIGLSQSAVSNASWVLNFYDSFYPATGGAGGPNTVVVLFVNFCAASQALGGQLISTLGQAEFANLASLVGAQPISSTIVSASTSTAASTTTAPPIVVSTTSAPSILTGVVRSTQDSILTGVVRSTASILTGVVLSTPSILTGVVLSTPSVLTGVVQSIPTATAV